MPKCKSNRFRLANAATFDPIRTGLACFGFFSHIASIVVEKAGERTLSAVSDRTFPHAVLNILVHQKGTKPMSIRSLLLAAGTISLVAAPLGAASIDTTPASQPVAGEAEVGSIESSFIVGALLAAGVVILIIADDDDDDPVSP